MNTSPAIPNPAAEEQAALWAARLDGGLLSTEDQTALNAWLAEHPAHRALLSNYCQFSADLEEQLPELVAAGRVVLPVEKPRRSRAGWFAALTLATAALVVFGLWVGRPNDGTHEFATTVAKRQNHTLADGTRVVMNANSSLVVENFTNERRVRLASGEAFFAVAKDRTRPFIVVTPAGTVQVTGTEFSVRSENAADGSQLEVTVAEGSVKVRSGAANEEHALVANEQLTSKAGAVTVARLSASDLEDALAWREGKAVFRGTRLEDAAARFARYHGIHIVVEGSARDIAVGSVYTLDHLDIFLDSLPALKATAVREGSGRVLIRASSDRR